MLGEALLLRQRPAAGLEQLDLSPSELGGRLLALIQRRAIHLP